MLVRAYSTYVFATCTQVAKVDTFQIKLCVCVAEAAHIIL